MIRNYSDHAANERTFLAWVRTAIAVMAFGFVVAKFNFFLRIAVESANHEGHPVNIPSTGLGGIAGLALIIAGTAMVAVAAVRFVHTGRAIDSPNPRTDTTRVDLMLAGLMLLLGVALVIYLGHTLVTGV